MGVLSPASAHLHTDGVREVLKMLSMHWILCHYAQARLRRDFISRFRLTAGGPKTMSSRNLTTRSQEKCVPRAMGKQIGGDAEAQRSSVISGVNASLSEQGSRSLSMCFANNSAAGVI